MLNLPRLFCTWKMLQVLLSSLDYGYMLISRCVILNRERGEVHGFRIFITMTTSDSVTLTG